MRLRSFGPRNPDHLLKLLGLLLCAVLFSGSAVGQAPDCNLADYKPLEGLTATIRAELLEVKWRGEHNQQLRVQFGIRNSQPVVRELAASTNGSTWRVLGRDLTPEFQVTSGKRRL